MVTKKKPLPEDHFERYEGVPGFLYIARNPHHGEDVYKVGCTTEKSAQLRINTLNIALAKGGSGSLGYFELCHHARTLNARGAEKLAHAALKKYSITNARAIEFFKAPIHDIMASIDVAAKTADERQRWKIAQNEREKITAFEQARKNHAVQSTQPSSTIEIIDFKCPSCNIELTLARPQANDSNRLRCTSCKHLFYWSEWLKKQANDRIEVQISVDAVGVASQKTQSEVKTKNVAMKYFGGLFLILAAFPFLSIILRTPEIVPSQQTTVNVSPAITSAQISATQQPEPTIQKTEVITAPQPQVITTQEATKAKPSGQQKTNKQQMEKQTTVQAKPINEELNKNLPEVVTAIVTNTTPKSRNPLLSKTIEVIEKERIEAQTKQFGGCAWFSATEWKCK